MLSSDQEVELAKKIRNGDEKALEKLIKANGGKYLEEVRLFDIFRGKQVGEGLKSVAYSVVFRADDRTLQDSDIQKAMERILETLQSELNAELRK